MTTTMFTDALITAAAVFVLMLVCLLLGAPPPGAVLVGLSFGLGSYAFPHALTLFTEPGTALAVIAAVYFAIRAARRGRTSRSCLVRRVRGRRALVPRLGRALPAGVRRLAARRGVPPARDGRLRRVIEVGAWYTAGALVPLLLLLVVNWWRYGSATNFGYALGTATDQSYPITRGVVNQWFSSGKSIFLYAPIAIVVVLGLGRSVQALPMEMILLGSIVVVNTLFFARVQFWSGDWAWGPRYMQIVVAVPRGDGRAADGRPRLAPRARGRERARLRVRGAARGARCASRSSSTRRAGRCRRRPSRARPIGTTATTRSIWHTRHWQQILYQLRHLPARLSNTLDHVTTPLGPIPVTRYARQAPVRVLVAPPTRSRIAGRSWLFALAAVAACRRRPRAS